MPRLIRMYITSHLKINLKVYGNLSTEKKLSLHNARIYLKCPLAES